MGRHIFKFQIILSKLLFIILSVVLLNAYHFFRRITLHYQRIIIHICSIINHSFECRTFLLLSEFKCICCSGSSLSTQLPDRLVGRISSSTKRILYSSLPAPVDLICMCLVAVFFVLLFALPSFDICLFRFNYSFPLSVQFENYKFSVEFGGFSSKTNDFDSK